MDPIKSSLYKLQLYIESNNYKGFDPYDALQSPFFNLPLLRSNKVIRFGTQQLVKRFPFNLHKLLLIPKGYNPVTLGLCLQGYAYLSQIIPESRVDYLKKGKYLICELKSLISSGYSGACWGYDFDWEHRYMKIEAFKPTVVATGIITNGIFEYYKISKDEDAIDLCASACNFILNDLTRSYQGENYSFSYSPTDNTIVFNASMKAVRCLSQVYSVTKKSELIEAAEYAVNYVLSHQQADGSWVYGKQKTTDWIDNYHTGYILDCLDEYYKISIDPVVMQSIKAGFGYYVKNLFESNRLPNFYSTRMYPLACTAASQSLLTLTRFNNLELAINVANYMINYMQDKKQGYFYFRKFKYYQIKTSYMRWSNAWMFAALAFLLYKLGETK
jgi:hypothetical protein